jgi:hypothetical protein
LQRRHALWSTRKRRLLGSVFALGTLPYVFPDFGSKRWLLGLVVMALVVIAAMKLPVLFIARDRLSGMRHALREVWIRPAAVAHARAEILVDGRVIGDTGRAEIWIYEIDTLLVGGDRVRQRRSKKFSLSLLVDGTIYEVERSLDDERIRRTAALLAGAAWGDASRVRAKHAGTILDEGKGMTLASLALAVPAAAKGLGTTYLQLSPHDVRFAIIGGLALVVLAANGVLRLAEAMSRQLDAAGFARSFPGARPARPIPWLTVRIGKRIALASCGLLCAAVATLALGR